MRDLTGPLQTVGIRDLLQSLFIAEALEPSNPLWILSGWISDISIVDNSSRQFSGVDPDWPVGMVSFSQVFRTLLSRGGRIALVLRDVDHNQRFVARIARLKSEYPKQLLWYLGEYEHEKGIVGHDFEVTGSMNFTHNGVEVNGEHLIYRTDPAVVSGRRLTLQDQWGELFDE